MKTKTIDYKYLVEMGFPKSTARQIIRQSKLKMVQKGYAVYDNKRLGSVPITAVEEILGFQLQD